jgi:hypothetical protein
MLVSVAGRKSGRTITTPTNYVYNDGTLWVVSWRNRTWWRNLRNSSKVRILLEGKDLEGVGSVVEDEKLTAAELCEYFQIAP